MKNVIFQVTSDINEPVTINEAFSGEHPAEWKKVTRSEYDSHMDNHTWDLVPCPEGKNIVRSRWVFTVKRDASGSIQKYKARLVGKVITPPAIPLGTSRVSRPKHGV